MLVDRYLKRGVDGDKDRDYKEIKDNKRLCSFLQTSLDLSCIKASQISLDSVFLYNKFNLRNINNELVIIFSVESFLQRKIMFGLVLYKAGIFLINRHVSSNFTSKVYIPCLKSFLLILVLVLFD